MKKLVIAIAWAIYRMLTGEHRAKLAMAMKAAWAFEKVHDWLEEGLLAAGYKVWEKGKHKRIYINYSRRTNIYYDCNAHDFFDGYRAGTINEGIRKDMTEQAEKALEKIEMKTICKLAEKAIDFYCEMVYNKGTEAEKEVSEKVTDIKGIYPDCLHDYQKYSADFIRNHSRCALMLDMGLGKTVSTLTAISEMVKEGNVKKVLVIAPLRVAKIGWSDEVEKWEHLHGLTYSVLAGKTPAKRVAALQEDTILKIINRENVVWLSELDDMPKFDMIVIDELSSFKSYTAKRFKALRKMADKVERVVGLTGTPTSNGLMDLFAEMAVIDGGKRLGKYITNFRKKYYTEGRKNSLGFCYEYHLKSGAEEQIHEAIADITVSMKAVDYLKMPKKLDINVPVELSRESRKVYHELADESIYENGSYTVVAKTGATLYGKLHQLANGIVYDDGNNCQNVGEEKAEALLELIEAAQGKPVMVAYWYQGDFAKITSTLDKNGIEWSALGSDEQTIRDWNAGKIKVLLLHPASAGHGLNLQAGGNTFVWYSIPDSLELYQQANARLWRQGQKSETVKIYHIYSKNTVDETIISALQSKEATQEKLMAAVKATIKKAW